MIKFIIFSMSIITIVFLSTTYLHGVDQHFSAQLVTETEQREMRHVFVDFKLVSTDKEGKTQHALRSPHTVFVADDNETHLDFPQMVLYREASQPIEINSNTATIDHTNNITTLFNNVEVTIPNDHRQTIQLNTEKLLFDNHKQRASTDQPVVVQHGKSSMQGVGMIYDFTSENITFLNQVRGIYTN